MNLNGDVPLDLLIEAARAAEDAGFDYVWVGESVTFLHPYPVIATVLEHTKEVKVGSGIISPLLDRCLHIRQAYRTLKEAYGDRLLITLAPGDEDALNRVGVERRHVFAMLRECRAEIKEGDESMPVFFGAAGPRIIRMASREVEGILLNFINPEYVEWALSNYERDVYTGVYGPALILPDEENMDVLRMASAIVARGHCDACVDALTIQEKIGQIDDLVARGRWDELSGYDEWLLDRFSISGSLQEIQERVERFHELGVDQVVFGAPINRNPDSIRRLNHAFI